MDHVDDALFDPTALSTRDDLARALTALRERRGATVRDLARAAGVPAATVSGYLTGRHVPPLAATEQFVQVLTALGVPDDEVPAWLSAVTRLRRAPGRRPVTATAPYRGLAAYQPEDAALFFGREDLTEALTVVVRGTPTTPVVVIGSSGSGKSSLLRAGLAARLRAEGVHVTVTEPGDDPAAFLDAEVDDLAPGAVLVVDQLEAVFGTDVPAAVTDQVFDRLDRLQRTGVTVVVGLRGDFFDAVLGVETAARWLVENQFLVGPLPADALRRVIVEPARATGIEIEAALVEVLVSEATGGPGARLEPGALPLLSHALYATWLAASGHRLTLAHYREAGGFAGAIAQTGEAVHESLTEEQQAAERDTLLRLVQVRDGFSDMRRSVRASAFTTPAEQQVMAAYVEARLITSDRDHVQLAHEALLTALPRLRGWLEEDRDGLRLHNRLAEAAQHWADSDQDGDLLYRGSALEAALRWARGSGHALTQVERDFLDRSDGAEVARVTARRRAGRRLHALVAVLAVLALSTGGLAAVSVVQSRRSAHARDVAVSRQLAVTAQQLAATDPALSGQVAVAATLEADTVEARSALLSAAGRTPVSRLAATGGVLNSVVTSPDGTYVALAGEGGRLLLWSTGDDPHQLAAVATPGSRYHAAFTGDGARLATAGAKGALEVWDVSHPTHPVPVTVAQAGTTATFYGVAFSGDGTALAAAASDGTVQLWRTADGGYQHVGSVHAFTGTVQAVTLDRTGGVLAAGGSDGLLGLWDVRTPVQPVPLGAPVSSATGKITSLDLSPDGRTLAVGAADDVVHLWDVSSPAAPVAGLKLVGPASWVNSVRFDATGTQLAAASSDKHLWVWSTATGAVTASLAHATTLISADWSHDSTRLYSGGADGMLREWTYPGTVLGGFAAAPGQAVFSQHLLATATKDGVRLWDVADPTHPSLLSLSPFPGKARLDGSVAVSAALHLLVAGDTTGGLSFWDIADTARPRYLTSVQAHDDWIDAVAFDPTGTRLAATSDDRSVTFWDLSNGVPSAPTARLSHLDSQGTYVNSVAFSPDSRTVAAAVLSGRVVLIDVTDLAHPAPVGAPLTGPKGYVYSAAFSPDGSTLAASGDDSSIWLWDVSDRARPEALGAPLLWADGHAMSVRFSPDGRYLGAGMTDGTVRLWDVTDPKAPRRWASLDGVPGNVFGVDFSPDSSYVSAAGVDRTVRIWPLSLAPARQTICAAAGRGLGMSAAEWNKAVDGVTEPTLCP
ncbi:helix-turn-helix domain-containing protein [Cellulomonas sp. SG140]|uniref:nSTAND1 domain-containing NTPase n=1 Tax=Cellulomonas sp. SG140 TaxID=2976536 RepID=UPI0021E84220|nr:helix-turn-helix domain-containing protein [Cellulomonas sp. SG140]